MERPLFGECEKKQWTAEFVPAADGTAAGILSGQDHDRRRAIAAAIRSNDTLSGDHSARQSPRGEVSRQL
jgi:hypothetical protein